MSLLANHGLIGRKASTLLNGLINYWLMDANADDSVGSNDGTVNGAVLASGLIGNGYQFDGSNDFINVGRIDLATLTFNDFSISVWFKPTGGVGTYQILIGKDKAMARDFDLGFGNTSGKFIFFSFASAMLLESSANIINNSWNHALVIRNAGTTYLHINGSPDNFSSLASADNYEANADVNFGRREFSGFEQYFTGIMDEVAIWNRVLTSAEILEIYNSGAGKQYPF